MRERAQGTPMPFTRRYPALPTTIGIALALLAAMFTSQPAPASFLEALFAPDAKLWPLWQIYNPNATASVDHGAWHDWLSRHVIEDGDGLNRVDYAAVAADDHAALKAYLAELSATAVSELDRPAQLAFWINLYNATTIDLVLDHYPVESIRDIKISPGLFAFGPWDKKLLTVEGEQLSLNDIEHRILRPIWRDPRIHYAVNCASVGCPNLQPVAFTADNTEALLEAGARTYVNSLRGVEVTDDKLTLSSIYNWFMDDFGGDMQGVVAHLRRYAEPGLAAQLAGRPRLDRYRYDWILNDAARSGRS